MVPTGKGACAVVKFITTCKETLVLFARDEAGPSATEYAILLAVLILGSMGVIQSIGGSFRNIYLVIVGKIPEA